MNVLMISANNHPSGDAGAIRVETFAKLLKSIGCNVLIVGLGKNTEYKIKNMDGIDYISLRSARESLFSRLMNIIFYWKRLKKYVIKKFSRVDCFFIYGTTSHTITKVKKYALKNNSSLIIDCVEWYSPEQFKRGKFAYAYREKNKINSRLIDKNFKVIAISSFLEKYYSQKGIFTKQIPVIMDTSSISFEKVTDEEKIVFLYAGMPGKKDYLAEIISAFSLLSKNELNAIELRIIGVNREDLICKCGADINEVEYLGNAIKCFGRVSREDVLQMLKTASFTVLLRNSQLRYAKAGFPTKVVESLASATPVICNLSSDLGEYLVDGYNSVICSECSSTAMVEAIKRAIAFSYDDRKRLCENARTTAESSFDYLKYADAMRDIIWGVQND